MKFKTAKINCINCVNLIKNSLESEFGAIEIDLENQILSINLDENKLENFEKEFKELGFELVKRLD